MTSTDPWQKAMDNVEQLNREARQRERKRRDRAIAVELLSLADWCTCNSDETLLRSRAAELDPR